MPRPDPYTTSVMMSERVLEPVAELVSELVMLTVSELVPVPVSELVSDRSWWLSVTMMKKMRYLVS